MKQFIISFILFFTVHTLFAQQILQGKITDNETGAVIPGATVTVAGTNNTVLTNDDGLFKINSVGPVNNITITSVGYQTTHIKVSESDKLLNIRMSTGLTSLTEIKVTGYETNRRLMETAGSISLLTAKQLQRGSNLDIQGALNTVPGVKMDDYLPGDYRISIRGSVISDPWGIRNIKLYLNDIPLSAPDGSASHGAVIDPNMLGSIEVLKGPSGSLYGSGNGGVILYKSAKAIYGENQLEAGYTAGSYGLSLFNTSYKTAGDNYNFVANVVNQSYDGYRENGWSKKNIINIFGQLYSSKKRTISFLVNHTTGGFGIAGGLDSEQVVKNPRQATQYCQDNKISVRHYDYTVIGASQQYKFSDKFQNTTSVYSTFETLDHPYGSSIYYNGLLKQSTGGYGMRTKFVFSPDMGNVKAHFTLGGEYQFQHLFENTFQIVNDIPGTWAEPGKLTEDLIFKSNSNIVFGQAEFDFPSNIFLTVGASYNKLSYNILDLFQDSGHVNNSGDLDFKPKVSPRIGLVKEITNNFAIHGSISYGYSPPPISEINDADGTLNTSIKPEDGVNYEIGFRGSLINDKLNYDISGYQMFLTNAIVPVVNIYGTTSYRNAGKTDQKGIEGSLSYLAINDKSKTVSLLNPFVNVTGNFYRFMDYEVETFDYNSYSVIKKDNSGNKVTGVVPFTLVAGIDMETKPGLYGNAVLYHYSEAPMNDANTAYSNAYSLLNMKVGYKMRIHRIGFDISAGINNALNAKYSSLILLNADASGEPAGYFNPSPGTNFYGGLKVNYSFNK